MHDHSVRLVLLPQRDLDEGVMNVRIQTQNPLLYYQIPDNRSGSDCGQQALL